jgi:hypothetical protein
MDAITAVTRWLVRVLPPGALSRSWLAPAVQAEDPSIDMSARMAVVPWKPPLKVCKIEGQVWVAFCRMRMDERRPPPPDQCRTGTGQSLPLAHATKPSFERLVHSETCPLLYGRISALAVLRKGRLYRRLTSARY